MSKVIIVSKLAIIFLLSIDLISCSYEHKTKVIDTIKSPDKNYEIKVWRAEAWGILDGGVKYVSLTTDTDTEKLNLKDPLYFEKDYDGDSFNDFESTFPDRRWINDKVFWMGKENELDIATNKIRIKNASAKKINQVIVTLP